MSVADDWDAHWSQFGAAAESSPAAGYRMRLILEALRRSGCGPQSRILDIGSGQGEIAGALCQQFPGAQVMGVELSATGVKAASERVPSARFHRRDLLSAEPGPSPEFRATHAVCSEVIEHLDQPSTLLANASEYMAPGCCVVVTVPGGPMTATGYPLDSADPNL